MCYRGPIPLTEGNIKFYQLMDLLSFNIHSNQTVFHINTHTENTFYEGHSIYNKQ